MAEFIKNMTEADDKRRKVDSSSADMVSLFVEKTFYNLTSNFRRINEKYEQVRGIDTKFTFNGYDYICDEKATVRYRNLQTFCMELSTIPWKSRKGEEKKRIDGWFIDKSKINNSYMFIWIDKTKTALNEPLTSTDDIQTLEIALVKKSKIFEYLASIGWTKEKLKVKNNRILSNPNEDLGDIKKNGCKFSYSKGRLAESPINILLSRKTLIEISDFSKKYETSN